MAAFHAVRKSYMMSTATSTVVTAFHVNMPAAAMNLIGFLVRFRRPRSFCLASGPVLRSEYDLNSANSRSPTEAISLNVHVLNLLDLPSMQMFYGGNDPGWIIGRPVFQIPMTFDRHSQFYNSRGCPGKSGEVSERVPSHAAKTHVYSVTYSPSKNTSNKNTCLAGVYMESQLSGQLFNYKRPKDGCCLYRVYKHVHIDVENWEKVVDLAIPICCDDFVGKIHKKLGALEGVTSVEVDRKKQKVTVKGKLKIEDILYQAQAIKSNATIWQD